MSPYTILYLDDEADNLLAFTAVFRRHYTVLTTQYATEAYDLLSQNRVQVVISDQRMPHISGVDFLSEVSRRYPDIIRMILTGYSDMQAIINAINKGKIYYYITKPWKFDELKVIIDKAIETFELRIANEKLINENHALILKNLQQEKENMTSRYEVLKNQINPHFLFNSLNTLASLISTDAPSALRFTTKFAKIYRLILEYGEQPLITLTQEMELLESYMFLQHLRFGNSLSLDANIKDKNYVLPPFGLQFLAENVIKHNIISENNPMVIQLVQNGDNLLIKNSIHPKNNLETSTGIGLKNLNSRYFLLTQKEIEITNDGEFFMVNIPLIPQG
jgi:LytS/YehU family sensor histidine kinase